MAKARKQGEETLRLELHLLGLLERLDELKELHPTRRFSEAEIAPQTQQLPQHLSPEPIFPVAAPKFPNQSWFLTVTFNPSVTSPTTDNG